MKVKIIKQTVAGKKQVKVGEILDLEEKEAKLLIQIKRAVPHVDEAATGENAENEKNETTETESEEKSGKGKKTKDKTK